MKHERINGHTIDLDKVCNLEYDDDTFVLIITLKYYDCLPFTKREEIRGLIRSDYEKLFMKWDAHKKTVIPRLVN